MGRRFVLALLIGLIAAGVLLSKLVWPARSRTRVTVPKSQLHPRDPRVDVSGYFTVTSLMRPWRADATLGEIALEWNRAAAGGLETINAGLAEKATSETRNIRLLTSKVDLQLFGGDALASYDTLLQLREKVERDPRTVRVYLGPVIFLQGVTAMRRAENDNCIACRTESACIVPINKAAVHANPTGSRLAVKHFTEYLELFPDDVGVRWLREVALSTLGEDPGKLDPDFHRALERFFASEFDIGRFRDESHAAGFDRMNMSGGAIMDDFDGDGLLDVVVTATDPTEHMAVYHNRGDGTFEDRTVQAGVSDQLGGLVCYQADFDNDGQLDIFIPRGAWLKWPIRPSLLRNDGPRGFVDVTEQAGLLHPVNSNAAAWGDFDNDGLVDLFVACEHQSNRLYRNKGDGTFEEVAAKSGVDGYADRWAKGCTWIDYDNDGYQDLFVSNLEATPAALSQRTQRAIPRRYARAGHRRSAARIRLLGI